MSLTARQFVEQYAIQEKIRLLDQFNDGQLTEGEVMRIIQDRRVEWIKNNIDRLKIIYRDLPPPLMAHRIIFFEHMYIYPPDSVVIEQSPRFIIIRSYNFCPYLEACQRLGLNTKIVCKNICEQPFNAMIKYIHPRLKFSRNYNCLRPEQQYCEEYIELT